MRQVIIKNQTQLLTQPIQVWVCETFYYKLRGFMFQAPISNNQGLLINQSRESRIDAAIHMFFVNFDLAIIWLNQSTEVVDTCLAHRWHPFYMPAKPAQWVLEIHPSLLNQFRIGDQLSFENVKMD